MQASKADKSISTHEERTERLQLFYHQRYSPLVLQSDFFWLTMMSFSKAETPRSTLIWFSVWISLTFWGSSGAGAVTVQRTPPVPINGTLAAKVCRAMATVPAALRSIGQQPSICDGTTVSSGENVASPAESVREQRELASCHYDYLKMH